MTTLAIALGSVVIGGAWAFLLYVGFVTGLEGQRIGNRAWVVAGYGLSGGLTLVSLALVWRTFL